jgi:ABC-type polysaccharide/polyol phosphate export permease
MARLPGTLFARNLVERRGLVFQLVRRDFEQRFVGSAAGWLWGIINPLVQLLSWTFVFGVCLGSKPPAGGGTDSYSLYLFAGMLPWLLFQETVMRSSNSLLDQANLITKTVFPAEVIPISVFLSSLISHAMALALAIVTIVVLENHIGPFLLLLPVYMALLGMFAVGIGWIASSLQVYLRDTVQVVGVVLTFWLWLTPLFITEDQVPEKLRFLIFGNPLTYIVKGYRQALLSSQLPEWSDLGIVTIYATVTFVLGGLFFRHMKRGFADVL